MNELAPIRLAPGLHPNIPEGVYHRDPAEEISASASVLRTLYDKSPEHAWMQCARLNPAWEPSAHTPAQANGTILHAMVLDQPAPYRALDFDDFRTAAAKAARDATLACGLIPILAHKLDELAPVATSLRARLARDFPQMHAAMMDPETQREITAIWRERDIVCRCRFDILPPARFGFTINLKFTGLDAEPEDWAKKLRDDYLFQADLYPRGVAALRGDAPEERFLVCETKPPYGVSMHAMDPELAGKARRRVNVALERWAWCLKENRWPCYAPVVHYSTPPAWWLNQDNDAAARDALLDRLMRAPRAELESPEALNALIVGDEGNRLTWAG